MSEIERLQKKLTLALAEWMAALAKQAREEAELDAEIRQSIRDEDS